MSRIPRSARLVILVSLLASLNDGLQAAWFIRGDVSQNERLTVTDAVLIFRHLFAGHPGVAGCLDAADVDGDGKVAITDGIHLLTHLFLGGPPPRTDIDGCWFRGSQGCDRFQPCESMTAIFVWDRFQPISDSAEFRKAQSVLIDAIVSMSDASELGFISFGEAIDRFPTGGVPARVQDMESAAVAHVMSLRVGMSSCAGEAVIEGLAMASRSSTRKKAVFFISYGWITCPDDDAERYRESSLAEIRERNIDAIPIHAILLGTYPARHDAWLRDLAAQNHGSFWPWQN